MILLSSTSDKIQLITGSAGSIRSHATWVDNISNDMTPGRTNTAAITSATTTDIVESPASSTYRSVKFITITNDTGSITNTLTLQHTDGTNIVPLWYGTLQAGEYLQYDHDGFIKYNTLGMPLISSQTTPTDIQLFDVAGTYTWTKPTNFNPSFVMIKIWGAGGGGGGGSSLETAVASHGGSGGGGGAYNTNTFLASEISATVTVTVGTGGPGGTGGTNSANGTNGTAGGNSSFGTYIFGYGGGAGAAGTTTAAATSGGSGGGQFSAGNNGSATASAGGLPLYNAAIITVGSIAGAGSGNAITATATASLGGLSAEFGGGAGGGQPATAAGASYGGSSIWGGAGGGCGGCHTAVPAAAAAGDGGSSSSFTSGGGGLAGTSGVNPGRGRDGRDGNFYFGGSGGGGGGSTITSGLTAGAGGGGGERGGGGGGGGAAFNPGTGGAGGAGGSGCVIVYSW